METVITGTLRLHPGGVEGGYVTTHFDRFLPVAGLPNLCARGACLLWLIKYPTGNQVTSIFSRKNMLHTLTD